MSVVVELDRVRKEYGGLRPLRVAALRLERAQRQALTGIDAGAAEALVNILTGAMLPDEGVVRVCGRDTSSVTDLDDWLDTLDHMSMISVRAVLVDELTVAQNLAMAFTLSVDPVAPAIMGEVRAIAVEAGVPLDRLESPLAAVAQDVKARCHLARALSANPQVLLLEHANALTTPADAPAFGRDIARVAERRHLAVLALTADDAFARAVATRVFAIDAATGRLVSRSGWRQWFQ